jgi:hypothetical protein
LTFLDKIQPKAQIPANRPNQRSNSVVTGDVVRLGIANPAKPSKFGDFTGGSRWTPLLEYSIRVIALKRR